MFSITDFLNLMKYFKTGETTSVTGTSEIDSNLLISADDSKAKATDLFNDNIDLNCFATDDYKRLKNFMIPWYASLRTFISTMQTASDVRSLPEDHLNALFNSFGFVDGLTKITSSNKIDFFYDLVNLYKIKGTPECIGRVLSYFGFQNIELFEYWLQYDENKRLVFHPEKIISTIGYDLPAADVPFYSMVGLDPHWFLTADQINNLFLINKIAFPSKSPYFGIRPLLYFQGGIDGIIGLLVLYRIVQDAYYEIGEAKYREKNYLLEFLRIFVTVLDLYLGITYLMRKLYNRTNDSTDSSFMCYNGELMSETRTFQDIVDEHDNLIARANNQTIAELDANRILYDALYTRPVTTDFIRAIDRAGEILEVKNIELKNAIDAYYAEGKGEEVLAYLISDLVDWMRIYISPGVIDLASLILGFSSIEYIREVINFFKPYRARFILAENAYIFKDPLHDAVICEDEIRTIRIREQILDWDTANSTACCDDSTACLYYSRETYDCGSEFDRGASTDSENDDPEMFITHNEYDHYNYHTDGQWLLQTDSTAISDFIVTEDGKYLIAIDKYETYVSNNYRGYLDGATPTFACTQPVNITGVTLSEPSGPVGTYDLVFVAGDNTLSWDGGTPVKIVDSTATSDYYLLQGDETSNTIIAYVPDLSELPNTNQTDSITISYGTPEIIDSTFYYHLQDGGPVTFDSGGVFDAPAISDVCEIYVCPVP